MNPNQYPNQDDDPPYDYPADDDPAFADMDTGFQPQGRARANTWPQGENFGEGQVPIKSEPEEYCDKKMVSGGSGGVQATSTTIKKNSSRRNAWGNLSYADLITQAIASSPDKRLTLSQIYEWMVHNIPFFKDKGDSNSSAGWKNSIRHNLSLHSRFTRTQNEGTGKSSWWVLNPDAKPGKSSRRRANSMETKQFERRRGRVKKKVEALRNGLDATPSPSSSVSETLDVYPESPLPGFQLSPDFRPRASSNASTCSRRSPIPALEPADWNSGYYGSPDQLSGNFECAMRIDPPHPPPQFVYSNAPPPYPPNSIPYQLNECALNHGQPCLYCQQNPPLREDVSSPYSSQSSSCSPPATTVMGQLMASSSQSSSCSPPATTVMGQLMAYSSQPSSCSPPATTVMGQLMASSLSLNPTLLDDLNLNVDAIVQHELFVEGELDFNFKDPKDPKDPPRNFFRDPSRNYFRDPSGNY